MRNPLNSWSKSDSVTTNGAFYLGEDDAALARKSIDAGTDHRKFLRMMHFQADITAPLYWWKEFDTYRMGVEKNSCSTMHKLMSRPLTPEDFSTDGSFFLQAINNTISAVNNTIESYKAAPNDLKESVFRTAVQMLPACYNQTRTVDVSFEALNNMYYARRYHKLSEWREFCSWLRANVPYAEVFL